MDELKKLREDTRMRAQRFEYFAKQAGVEAKGLRKKAKAIRDMADIMVDEANGLVDKARVFRVEAEEERRIIRRLSNKDLQENKAALELLAGGIKNTPHAEG